MNTGLNRGQLTGFLVIHREENHESHYQGADKEKRPQRRFERNGRAAKAAAGLGTFLTEKVDADHGVSKLLKANPTAMARRGAISRICSSLCLPGLTTIFRNGYSSSTGMPNSSRSKSSRPGTRAVPPATTMRRMFSPLAVARKKSKVFWISRIRMSETERRIDVRCSSVTPGRLPPIFKRSASSKFRSNSFCSASVYWLPPTE